MLGNAISGATAERNLAGGVGVQGEIQMNGFSIHAIANGNYVVDIDSNGDMLDRFRYIFGTTQGDNDLLSASWIMFDGSAVSAGVLVAVDADGSFTWENGVAMGVFSSTPGTYWMRLMWAYGDTEQESPRYRDYQITLV